MRPGPETATGKLVRRQAKPKGRNWHWETCPTCRGEGKTRDRFSRQQTCETCKGRCRLQVDDYTGGRVVVHVDKTAEEAGDELPALLTFAEEFRYLLERDTKKVTCPFCNESGVYKFLRCEHCDGEGRVAVPGSWLSEPEKPRSSGGDAVDVQLAALERRDEAGHWHALELAITELRRRAPHCARVLADVYESRQRELDELDDVDEIALRAAVLFLDLILPSPIEVPGWVTKFEERRLEHLRTVRGRGADDRALQARNREIERLLRQSKPIQWIADHYGLSVRQVYEIRAAAIERAQGEA